ncbi:MAG TPA: methyltransferase domain-containing protein [Thermomicrobiaceae bacterium]|nr:methyltransferase domain-containing protein [Thermomicrobiaceae bacterium]
MAERAVHAFDGVAGRYDADFSRQQLGRWLRAAVWRVLGDAVAPGQQALDLGCGTGEDALWLAGRGVQVTALDASAGMLAVAREKAQSAALMDRISFAQADLNELPAAHLPEGGFDGAYADFGPLNCVADRPALGAELARLIRPGGRLVAVVMGPLCPWEVAWYIAHGHPRTAARRLRRRVRSRVGGGEITVDYPSPRRLRAEFAPGFQQIALVGLGTLLPPSDLGHLVGHAPRLFAALNGADERLRSRFPFTWLNDHYVAVFERR